MPAISHLGESRSASATGAAVELAQESGEAAGPVPAIQTAKVCSRFFLQRGFFFQPAGLVTCAAADFRLSTIAKCLKNLVGGEFDLRLRLQRDGSRQATRQRAG